MSNGVNIKLITSHGDWVIIVTDENRIFYCDRGEYDKHRKWFEIKGPDLNASAETDTSGRTYYPPQK